MRSVRIQVIAYETVRDAAGALPLLAPMSRIAGRLAPFVGAQALATDRGGAGVLLPGVDDVPGAQVVVVGAGNVGCEAARVAARIGARVTLFSRGGVRRDAVAAAMAAEGRPIAAFGLADGVRDSRFADAVAAADLVIGAVLEPGTLSPKLISRALVAAMRPGSVIVDVGIDHGGIAETSRMTKLSDPTYVECDVVHYAVPNMPALVARTATLALDAGHAAGGARAWRPRASRVRWPTTPAWPPGAMVRDGAIVHAGLAADSAAHQADRARVARPAAHDFVSAAPARRDEGLRLRRLVRQRQDDADRARDSAARRARRAGLARQARASRVRHRPAGQGLVAAPAGGLHRGARELQRGASR